MTELDLLIRHVHENHGKQEEINKVYLILLKTKLFVPIKKDAKTTKEEPFVPLFAKIDDRFFMAIFSTMENLKEWAGTHFEELAYVELRGKDVVFGIQEGVYLSLNPGTGFYKEFSPDEVKHLKKIVARIQQITHSNE